MQGSYVRTRIHGNFSVALHWGEALRNRLRMDTYIFHMLYKLFKVFTYAPGIT